MRSISRTTALTALAAAGTAAAVPRIARAQAEPLAVAGVYSDLFAEPFYAKDAGAFAKAGFDVNASSLVNAGAVAAAIGGGTLQLGTGDLVSGVNAIIAGVPIVLVAGGGLYIKGPDGGSTILAVADDSPIREPKDLAGKSIGLPTLVGMSTACVRKWLPTHGVPVSSVKFLEVPMPTGIAALQAKRVDVMLLSEPFPTFGKGQVRAIGSPFDVAADLAPDKRFCVSVWYANKSWFESNPARAKRAVDAIYETARWANAHREETFGVLVRDGHLDAQRAKGMLRTTYATALTPGMVQPVVTIAEENKMFQKQVTAEQLITRV